MNKKTVLIAYVLASLAMMFWSGNWVLGRAVRADIPPLGLNFWRWSVAVIVLLPFAFAPARRDWPIVRDNWQVVLGLGVLGSTLFQSMIYIGLHETEAINALLLNATAPLFIILIAWVAYREPISLRQISGIMISFIGVSVLVSRGNIEALRGLRLNSGDMWVLSALVVWGGYSVLLKRRPKNLNGISLVFYISVIGMITMLPLHLWEASGGAVVDLSSRSTLLSIGYTGVFASVLAFLCYNAAIMRIGPVRTAFFLHLMPVFGSIFAIAFLGERLGGYHMGGFVIVLAGVLFATTAKKAA
ncbi:MAG: DMT family transporter [Marinosulfonomonas sp.]|nr:DMT family transporter [Marinosulfonomonas sp.]